MYSKDPTRNGGMNPKHPRESPATNAAVMEGRPLSALDAARIAAEIATRKAGKSEQTPALHDIWKKKEGLQTA